MEPAMPHMTINNPILPASTSCPYVEFDLLKKCRIATLLVVLTGKCSSMTVFKRVEMA